MPQGLRAPGPKEGLKADGRQGPGLKDPWALPELWGGGAWVSRPGPSDVFTRFFTFLHVFIAYLLGLYRYKYIVKVKV